MLICHPVTSRPLIFLQKEAVLSPCNFVTTHLTACILKFYPMKCGTLSQSPGIGFLFCFRENHLEKHFLPFKRTSSKPLLNRNISDLFASPNARCCPGWRQLVGQVLGPPSCQVACCETLMFFCCFCLSSCLALFVPCKEF